MEFLCSLRYCVKDVKAFFDLSLFETLQLASYQTTYPMRFRTLRSEYIFNERAASIMFHVYLHVERRQMLIPYYQPEQPQVYQADSKEPIETSTAVQKPQQADTQH